MAMFNTGYQANNALVNGGLVLGEYADGKLLSLEWHYQIYNMLGFAEYSDVGLLVGATKDVSFFTPENFILGAIFFLPVYITTLVVGGHAEVAICCIRKHPVTEGFLVTSALFPLILPATIPLWQVALGILFGVIIGKEIFGGVGMNILNPALTARAFLFFAYPAEISGDNAWLPFNVKDSDFSSMTTQVLPDSTSGATYLSLMANPEYSMSSDAMLLGSEAWFDAFLGMVPGSMGETSALACLFGAIVLCVTKIASWRTMVGCAVGTVFMALILNGFAGESSNPMLAVPFYWHFVVGGWAFGAIFMATDPVSSPFTERGKFIYGFFIGLLVVLIRCVNPAYAEGMMLAILFMNMFSPLIDHFFVQSNIKRRLSRDAA
jgi:Na+-transporting NADH:ubiquinone oxidoreductase subunit B